MGKKASETACLSKKFVDFVYIEKKMTLFQLQAGEATMDALVDAVIANDYLGIMV